MNIKTNVDKPNVHKAAIRITIAHFQSPLNSGGKKPNNNTVHENPTGACLTTSYSGCLRFKVENATSTKNYLLIYKTMP